MAFRSTDYGDCEIVWPTEVHKATILWLHDIAQNCNDSANFVRQLNLPNVKWICPTAPIRPITSLGGVETTAWADVNEISENMEEDIDSFNLVSLFVISLLQHEPNNVMIGLGGIGLGAAVALYYASPYITGMPNINLRIIVGINGWLPGWRNLLHNMQVDYGRPSLAPSLPILLTQGNDSIVPFQFAYTCSETLRMAGFSVMFIPNDGDHYSIIPQVRVWLTINLQL